MKIGIVILACFFFVSLNAQNLNKERGKIGLTFSTFGKSDVVRFTDGSSHHESRYHYSLGVNYIYPLNNWLEAETGIEYSKYNIKLFVSPDGNDRFSGESKLFLLNVPLKLRANFLKFLFADAGTFIDFDFRSKEEIIDNQTGMGIAIGLGAKYDFKFGMSLFANPFVRLHSLAPFASKKNYPNRLFDGGIRFGITYDFNKR